MSEANLTELYKLSYSLCQAKLASQASAAIGADARAMSFSGLSVTGSALLIGLSNESLEPLSMLVGGLFLGIASVLAGYAARPVGFRFPGAKFSDLASDIDQNIDINLVLR